MRQASKIKVSAETDSMRYEEFCARGWLLGIRKNADHLRSAFVIYVSTFILTTQSAWRVTSLERAQYGQLRS